MSPWSHFSSPVTTHGCASGSEICIVNHPANLQLLSPLLFDFITVSLYRMFLHIHDDENASNGPLSPLSVSYMSTSSNHTTMAYTIISMLLWILLSVVTYPPPAHTPCTFLWSLNISSQATLPWIQYNSQWNRRQR